LRAHWARCFSHEAPAPIDQQRIGQRLAALDLESAGGVLLDLSNVCVVSHVAMSNVNSESPSDVALWLRSESANLWPALLGSLSLRRSPCIRENCAACQSGKQHQSYVLYSNVRGRRVAVYVPEELVPDVQRTLDNGRALQDLLHQVAPRYIKALKRERARAKITKSDEAEQ
jgi:hypothetical protein